MAYNSALPTTKIEGALLASLKTKKIEYNITQDKSSNYASLAEAIAAVDDDEYKVKGIVLTFYTGTDWVSKRYNGEDASGFADEGNWIDVGGAAGGTQYLDLSMFSEESGTLSEEDYQKVVKAYEDVANTVLYNETLFSSIFIDIEGSIAIFILLTMNSSEDPNDILISYGYIILSADKTYISKLSLLSSFFELKRSGSGTKALTDNGQYKEFAKPTKAVTGSSGTVTQQLSPNTFYKFGECSSLTITLGAEESGVENEYKFEFVSGSTPTTLSLPETVKWSGGSAPTMEASKTYQISIVNNLAVFAAF